MRVPSLVAQTGGSCLPWREIQGFDAKNPCPCREKSIFSMRKIQTLDARNRPPWRETAGSTATRHAGRSRPTPGASAPYGQRRGDGSRDGGFGCRGDARTGDRDRPAHAKRRCLPLAGGRGASSPRAGCAGWPDFVRRAANRIRALPRTAAGRIPPQDAPDRATLREWTHPSSPASSSPSSAP